MTAPITPVVAGGGNGCLFGLFSPPRLERTSPIATIDAHGSEWQAALRGIYVTDKGPPKIAIYPTVPLIGRTVNAGAAGRQSWWWRKRATRSVSM